MTIRYAAALALMGLLVPAEQASAATFYFTFSGAPLGNKGTAVGQFNIPDSQLPLINSTPSFQPNFTTISNLTVTVSGADSGNGVFSQSNFGAMYFHTPSPLDFTKQLVGQTLGNGLTFGQLGKSGQSGDFNLFSSNGQTTPTGVIYFTLLAGGSSAPSTNQLALVSLSTLAPTVPEPATWALMLIGFGMVGFAMRKRGNMRTTVSYA